MTHRDKSAVRGLIEELLAVDLAEADHGDAMRRLLAAALQDLVDAEATARIGAGMRRDDGVGIAARAGRDRREQGFPQAVHSSSRAWPRYNGSHR